MTTAEDDENPLPPSRPEASWQSLLGGIGASGPAQSTPGAGLQKLNGNDKAGILAQSPFYNPQRVREENQARGGVPEHVTTTDPSTGMAQSPRSSNFGQRPSQTWGC
jgi:hypothetical protein